MGFKCGIVGLPNVGKSTLFNALTKTAAAQAANYPFCTIEPNTGDVAVPDPRLKQLATIAGSKEIIPTRLTFVDIAGLVRGASKGEGLGNQFLANIRETDAIAHVLRCFEDSDISHVEDKIDPVSDAETVETELMLADLESLERRIVALRKKAAGKDKEAAAEVPVMEVALALLQEGKPARLLDLPADQAKIFANMNLLSSKPVLYVCNVDEESAGSGNAFSDAVAIMADEKGAGSVVISAAIEAEIAQLDADEQAEFMEAIDLAEPGLDRLIRTGYDLAAADHVLHRRPQGNPRLDRDPRYQGTPGCRCDPHRFRARLHSCPNHRLRALRHPGRRKPGQRSRQGPRRRQGICGSRRRRVVVQVQYVKRQKREPCAPTKIFRSARFFTAAPIRSARRRLSNLPPNSIRNRSTSTTKPPSAECSVKSLPRAGTSAQFTCV